MPKVKLMFFFIIPLCTAAVLLETPFKKVDASPVFRIPFPEGQVWIGQTRMNHNPQNAVDLNRLYDEGDTVIASAAGKVVKVKNLGNRSYGRYIVIDHGGGWQTLYGHLSAINVFVGKKVTQGQKIGAVGSTGGSTGAHLHYEQRYNGKAERIRWNGHSIFYWGSKTYKS
ncbi:Peptidase family M23 [Bacillus sp. OV194]|uniref:M23 family metallopeptidase n=1 Tax=Fictibacillus sp. B-59209 TaxID=3024873 RepID=UPI0008E55BDC|nr:M23 family metallopeptidase [Fictibacillus sp. B-59209]MED2970807.1 M23 family metallopeptidase [Fictibacillus sp. B-59209]SFE87522.1 Peptidase family M23 [Bacillus sp. OV194]